MACDGAQSVHKVILAILMSVLLYTACSYQSKKTLDMSRVKRIEFTATGNNSGGCPDPADSSLRLPLGTKYCLNPTGNKGDGNLYVCKEDGGWERTEEKCP
jgi:hypothetical protein